MTTIPVPFPDGSTLSIDVEVSTGQHPPTNALHEHEVVFGTNNQFTVTLTPGKIIPPNPTPPTPGPYPTVWAAPGRAPLSDAAAAALVQPFAENRPDNATANAYVPSDSELASFQSSAKAGNFLPAAIIDAVTGRPGKTLTTGELIAWAALKWGIPPINLWAQCVNESNWHQDEVGDSGESFSIIQIKTVTADHPGTAHLAPLSTAFALDYAAGVIFGYYFSNPDGDASSWVQGWTADDGLGAQGEWYDPNVWRGASAEYIATIEQHIAAQPWLQPGF